MSKHAMVQREGYMVPLIGVPPEAVLEECDLCHGEFGLSDLTWTGKQMLCAKCANENNEQQKGKTMRVLVACEYSGTVRDAFAAKGWDAWSCDLLPSENPGQHYQGDIFDIINDNWNLMIAHPPCTHLAVSGAAWFHKKQKEQGDALEFVRRLLSGPMNYIALENPISIISTRIRKPDQIIQPWMFGHKETKATCLWLKGLSKLTPTNNVKAETMALPKNQRMRLHYLPPGPDRWKERSRTFPGIAAAMADQWTKEICS